MSNTIIQIKRSSSSAVPLPGSLTSAEPAYSYLSGKLFIGNAAGDDVIAIGGKFFVDLTNASFNATNSAYLTANAAFFNSNNVFDAANAAFLTANTAFDKGNAAHLTANTSYNKGNAAHITANSAYDSANAGQITANSAYNSANAGQLTANTAYDKANAAHVTANTAYDKANAAHLTANTAYDKANSGSSIANAAYDFANTRFASAGGVITGDVSITGILTLTGNTVLANVETLKINDPLLYIAGNNYTSDIIDIGFVANYVNATGSNVHTGLFRDATIKEYYLFQGYDEEPIGNHIDPSANGFTLAVLNADIKTNNLSLAGTNTILWIRSSYDAANAGFNSANAGQITANAAYNSANAGQITANAAYNKGNSAALTANAAYDSANAGQITANSAYDKGNSAALTANAAYDSVNAAQITANVAFDKANTANVNAGNASFLTVGTIPSGRVTGDYSGITGLGTIISGTWNADVISVTYGGTGRSSITQNGVLYGNTSGPLKVTSAGTEGQVLQEIGRAHV